MGKMEPPPMSSAEAYPTFLYKISPVLSVQQSPSMVQSSPSSKQTITSIMSSNMSSNITSASNSLALEEMGLRRTRTVIPNSVKVQIAKVANQIPRMTQGEIAQMFGIDRTTVSKILKRRREYLGPDSESPPRAKYNCCKFPPLNYKYISLSLSFSPLSLFFSMLKDTIQFSWGTRNHLFIILLQLCCSLFGFGSYILLVNSFLMNLQWIHYHAITISRFEKKNLTARAPHSQFLKFNLQKCLNQNIISLVNMKRAKINYF